MNDRFKFRVWNNEHKQYVQTSRKHSVYISQEGSCIGKTHSEFGDVIFDYNTSEYIVEQCTGLKDKNGNLIYENDVVKSMIRTGYIKWNKGNMTWFVYVLKSNEIIALNSYLDGELEIIGNIHEQKDAA